MWPETNDAVPEHLGVLHLLYQLHEARHQTIQLLVLSEISEW